MVTGESNAGMGSPKISPQMELELYGRKLVYLAIQDHDELGRNPVKIISMLWKTK